METARSLNRDVHILAVFGFAFLSKPPRQMAARLLTLSKWTSRGLFFPSSGLSQGAHWAELPKNLPCILSGGSVGYVNKIVLPFWGWLKSYVTYLRDINSACEVCTLLKAKGLHCDMKSDRKHQPQVSPAPVSSLTRLHDACHLSCHAHRTYCMSLFLVHTIPPHL